MPEGNQPYDETQNGAAAEITQLFMVVRPDACPICEMHRGKLFWPDEAPPLPIQGCLKPSCSCEYRLFDANGPSLDQMMEAGIQAVKAGRMAEAQDWFVTLLQIDRYNEKAWLWLSGAAEDDQDRLECIQEVLKINPSNPVAQRGLKALQAKGVTAPEPATDEAPDAGS